MKHVAPVAQKYEAPQTIPTMSSTTNELRPDEKAWMDFNEAKAPEVVQNVTESPENDEISKEQQEQAKKDARNAARRERDRLKKAEAAKQAETDKKVEAENAEQNTAALEHTLEEPQKEADETEHEPEISDAVFEDATNEDTETDKSKLLDEMQLKLGKLDKVGITNECRNLMISKAHAGHKDMIKDKMKADKIAGLPSMSLEQLKEYCLWLVTLA